MQTEAKTRLDRLIALRDQGFPLAERMEQEHRLNFNLFMNKCGTEGCLLGWWTKTERGMADGWAIPAHGTPEWRGKAGFWAANAYFGEGAYYRLFLQKESDNQTNAECLAERRAACDEMIAELEA